LRLMQAKGYRHGLKPLPETRRKAEPSGISFAANQRRLLK
jgi:hypothetical protein